jgi:hypothetical protein
VHAAGFGRSNQEQIMKVNEGTIDRAVRVAAGVVLIGLAATGTVGMWGWIGVVPLATGLIGWCPAYTLLGFNTCSAQTK